MMNTKQKESAKPSRNVHSGKPELMHHQQSFLPPTSLGLSATGSLELRLVSSAILEHTNNNTSHSCLGLVIVSNDRRTKHNSYMCGSPGRPALIELQRQKTYLRTCAPSEDSDQPSLFFSLWGQRGLWSDCADTQADLRLRWAGMSKSTFSYV